VDHINELILDQFLGDCVTCFSIDSVAEFDQQALYPVEYLNSLNLGGLPPHKLILKVGAPIMLLRNMDPVRGHCNGTHYILRAVTQCNIDAQIASDEYVANMLLIPQIPLMPMDSSLPITLRRRPFPVRPAFAMSINKSQGQTLERAGVLLTEPVCTSQLLSVDGQKTFDSVFKAVVL